MKTKPRLVIEEPFLLDLGFIGDQDIGYMSIIESHFDIKRAYWCYSVPDGMKRGFHAHKKLKQFLIAIKGELEIKIEGLTFPTRTFTLDSPSKALFLPNNCWREVTYTKDAVLLSLASEHFSESDYMRDYNIFTQMKRDRQNQE